METPLLRVSRPVSACSRCRNAKVKCDGLLPACTACVRANRAAECSSANDQFAKGKERSYVASLESRIERLENQIAQTKRRASSTPMPDFSFTPTVFSNNASKIGRRRSQRKEASEMDDLVSDFGFLYVLAFFLLVENTTEPTDTDQSMRLREIFMVSPSRCRLRD